MKSKIPKDIKRILDEVKNKLKLIYGSKLENIILYGSYARGDATSGSDIDLIILLKNMKKPMIEREKYFNSIWELDLKYDTLISVIPFKTSDFQTRKLPLILNAKREGIFL